MTDSTDNNYILTKHGFLTTQSRSNLMKQIKAADTKVEVAFRKCFWGLGYRYRKNYKALPGKPDIAFTKHKVAVFIDGEFWHGYNWKEKKRKLKRNRDYWISKIEGNMARDKKYNKELKDMGWTVIRLWADAVKSDPTTSITKIVKHLEI